LAKKPAYDKVLSNMKEAKSEIIKLLNAAVGAPVFSVAEIITPPDSQLGDLGVAVFALAKQQKKNPAALAQELAAAIQKQLPSGWLKNCQAAGPYVNFFVAENILAKTTLKAIQRQGLKYGWQESPVRQRIMFEYSGPNTHKAFHVGHLRNTLLGAALVRLSRSQGNLVLAANYINDVGSHVAKVLWYLEKNPTSQKQPMGEVYARANGQLTEQPEFEGEVAAMMQRLEEVLPPICPRPVRSVS
jgi:arginyl-tRNA synthetase